MKTNLIVLSFFVNLLLLVAVVSPRTADRAIELARPGSSDIPAGNAPRSQPRPPGAEAAPPGDALKWSMLAADDARKFVEDGRAAGIPADILRALLQAKLNDQVSARRRELMATLPQIPYWRNPIAPLSVYSDPKMAAEMRQMTQANTRLLTELLGPDPASLMGPYERAQYGNLPADKSEQLRQVVGDYGEMMSAVRGGLGGMVLLAEDRQKLAFLEQEKDRDIKALLSPAEYEEYQFRASPTASQMRSELTYFEPTEAEFRTIFALRQPYDQRFNINLVGTGSDVMRARSEAQAALQEQIRAALGPARAADYVRATDYEYRNAVQLITRLELPKENATALWQAQKDLQARVNAIRSDRTLAQPAMIEKLSALQSEANNAIGAVLGAKGLEAYKQTNGQWLNTIVPVPRPTPPPAP